MTIDIAPTRLEEMNNHVTELADLIQRTTGLDPMKARTVIYWATATHGLPSLQKFPILSLEGSAGTGKSTIQDILRAISLAPSPVDGHMTPAAVRDNLGYETTAIVEEADGIDETLLTARYSRQTSLRTVKRQKKGEGFHDEALNLYGATVLHRRLPFRDHAVLSRSIVIKTKRATVVDGLDPEDVTRYVSAVQSIAGVVDWTLVPASGGSRIRDTWAPLVAVATRLEDKDWVSFAEREQARAEGHLVGGESEEPSLLVYDMVLSLAIAGAGSNPNGRVLLHDISEGIQREGGSLNAYQVGQIVREIGFETAKIGGKAYLLTWGKERLVEIGRELGSKDEWLDAHSH